MSKRSLITSVTPLPPHVSRETAVAVLHDHVEMIQMNPLVIRMEPTTPPPNATEEEVKVMKWYSITDEIVYVPGTKVKGETTYKAGFYNLPLGLQTHVFAPAGVDMKTKWSVGGSLPGEKKEQVELGLNAPREGLYIREDADLRCSVFLANFVKRNMKKGHHVLCERLIKRASEADNDRRLQTSRDSFSSESIIRRWDHLYDRSASALNDSNGPSRTRLLQYTPRDTSCACEGVHHEPSCDLYMQCGQIRNPSGIDAQRQPPSSDQSTLDKLLVQRAEREQDVPAVDTDYSPAGLHPCGCTGSVHSTGCPQYPDAVSSQPRPRSSGPELRLQLSDGQQQPYQLSLPASAERESHSAHPRTNPYSFSRPQSSAANSLSTWSGHTFRPQRPGEQAELPSTLERNAVEDDSPTQDLTPDPLLIRTPHGHAAVTELDGETSIARQYWSQRTGKTESMARG